MLPTKGYFQDIECPYFNSICGRPYCHFRHRKKLSETADEVAGEPEREETVVPTYKPTPKSELANIHNKSHIPISYVPDLAFRSERKLRPLPKIERPTYKPTPISILSSVANKRLSESEANGEHLEVIKEIKKNIADAEYDPTISLQPTVDINFEELSSEFDLIDEIISSNDKTPKIKQDETLVKTQLNKGLSLEKYKIKNRKKNSENDILIEKVGEKIEAKEKSKSDLVSDRYKKGDRIKNRTTDKDIQEKSNSDKSKKESSLERQHSSDKCKKLEKDKEEIKPNTSKEKHRSVKDNKQKSTDKCQERNKEKDSSRESKNVDKHKRSSKDKKKNRESSSEKSHKSSSRDKHRKEEHRDRKGKSSSSDKHKSRDRSRSRNRSKSSERNKSQKKSTRRSHSRTRSTSKERKKSDKPKLTEKISQSKSERKYSSDDSSKCKRKNKKGHLHKGKVEKISDNENQDYDSSVVIDKLEDNFSDIDLEEDETETLMQCYKIFHEYKPPEKEKDIPAQLQITEDLLSEVKNSDYSSKKRIAHSNVEKTMTYSQLHPPSKPKSVTNPGQALTNRYKLAKLAQANKEPESSTVRESLPIKRQASTLLEAARARKIRKEELPTPSAKPEPTCLVDEILQGTSKLSSSSSSSLQQPKLIKKIAPAQNVLLMAKAKERISQIKQTTLTKTIAHTQKAPRVAHVPEVSLSDIPDVLQADKSKLPVNVRTRFLTMIADECVKLYVSKQEAFERALNEEFACYEKCKVLVTYRNSAMLAVNRLRKEVQERTSSGLGLIGVGEDTGRDSKATFKGKNFYNKIEKWILTEEELDLHGYPLEDETYPGRVVIKNIRKQLPAHLDNNQRYCIRCKKIYPVDDDGWPLFEEECLYHPLKKRTIRGEQTYLCCRSNDDTGCATSDTHVSEGFSPSELEGFQTTIEPESDDDPRNIAVYALDCEMCYTTKGLELTRVTVVDTECKTIYESLVKPLNPIIDYNTRFSGITKEQMDRTSTNILQVQANILHLCNSKTILVGHSLESDMKALKIVHKTVIDTAVLFPHKMGLPHKRALKVLASEYLRKIIQNDIAGHDSAEDAVTCMELLKWKLKEELKSR